jgi:hypothetical protein
MVRVWLRQPMSEVIPAGLSLECIDDTGQFSGRVTEPPGPREGWKVETSIFLTVGREAVGITSQTNQPPVRS